MKKLIINLKNHTNVNDIDEYKMASLFVLDINPINVPQNAIIHHGNIDASIYVDVIYIKILLFIIN